MTQASRTFKLTVTATQPPPPVTGVPTWVNNIPENSGWVAVAAGPSGPDNSTVRPWVDANLAAWQRGNRIWDVRPAVLPSYGGGMADIIRSWCGGTVDPDRKEMLLVANGGHANYSGNETYCLTFAEDAGPRWKRLCDATPDAQFNTAFPMPTSSYSLTDLPATHLDGRPRASHSCGNYQFARDANGNGRVWYIIQTSVSNNTGRSGQGIISFDRDAVAALPGDFSPYDVNNPFPYQTHGNAQLVGESTDFIFNATAYDSKRGNIWGYGKTRAWAWNVNSRTISQTQIGHGGFTGGEYRGAWAVYVPDPIDRIFIGQPKTPGQPVWIHDPNKTLGTAGAMTLVNTTPRDLLWDPDSYWDNYASPGVDNGGWYGQGGHATAPYMQDQFGYGMGAVYSSGLIYVGPLPSRQGGVLGGHVRVLDPNTMTWTTMTNTGMPPVALNNPKSLASTGTQWGGWQRFNIIEWDNARLLVHAADTFGPTHVWRLPSIGQTATDYTGHYIAFEENYFSKETLLANRDFNPACVGPAYTTPKPGIKGVQMRWNWITLEPSPGSYNFSDIIAKLDLAQSKGLKLIVLPIDRTFNATNPVPTDLQANYSYFHNGNGWQATRWLQPIITRWQAMHAAMAAAIGNHPALAGIGTQETSVGLSAAQETTYSYTPAAYRDALISNLLSIGASFPTKKVFFYQNFLSGNNGFLDDVVTAVLGKNIVMGGPDILPLSESLLSNVYPRYDTFQNQIQMFCAAQFDSYRHGLNGKTADPGGPSQAPYHTTDQIFLFARDNLHINYCLWNWVKTPNPTDSRTFAEATATIAAYPTAGP